MRVLLILALLASLALAGCASNDDATEPTTDDGAATNTTADNETPEEEPAPDCVAPSPVPCVEPPASA